MKDIGKSDAAMRYFWPTVIAYVVFQLVSDVTAGKIISIGPAVVSVTVLYFPVTYIISDILTEVYGYEKARRALWFVMAASITAGLLYSLVVVLPAGPGFQNNEAYSTVLGQVPRILIAGWVAVFAGDIANNYVLSRLKVHMNGRMLWVRTITSTFVGQGLNTGIFYVGALWGVLPTDILVQAILWGWAIKVIVEILFTPLTYFVVGILKRAEGVDTYDYTANYSPLKF
ncbi:MAG: queuosine precursor transporter [Candidatus Moraniibacteriota bacterium]